MVALLIFISFLCGFFVRSSKMNKFLSNLFLTKLFWGIVFFFLFRNKKQKVKNFLIPGEIVEINENEEDGSEFILTIKTDKGTTEMIAIKKVHFKRKRLKLHMEVGIPALLIA